MSRQPAGCRSTPRPPTSAERAADHAGSDAAAGQLEQVRQAVGELVEHEPLRLASEVVAGHRADAGGERHRRSLAIVAEPTTRVPS